MLYTSKDKINKMLRSNLFHKFKCNICNNIYYGKTKRHSKVRACKHLGITTQKKAHVFRTAHNPSFDNFETFIKETNEFRFPLTESLLIFRDDPPLNMLCYRYGTFCMTTYNLAFLFLLLM